MKKKQTNNPLVKRDADNLPYFVSPNRKTYRVFKAQGLDTERVSGPRRENPTRAEFRVYREELAREFGSTTGTLKKKHIRRHKLFEEGKTNE